MYQFEPTREFCETAHDAASLALFEMKQKYAPKAKTVMCLTAGAFSKAAETVVGLSVATVGAVVTHYPKIVMALGAGFLCTILPHADNFNSTLYAMAVGSSIVGAGAAANHAEKMLSTNSGNAGSVILDAGIDLISKGYVSNYFNAAAGIGGENE